MPTTLAPNPFDLANAKARLNITDATKDTLLQGVLDASLGVIENYLDRKLLFQTETEKFYDTLSHTVQVRRYPIDELTSPATGVDVVDKDRGIVHFNGLSNKHELVLVYTGGFNPIPEPLLTALWTVFDNIYQQTQSGAVSTAGEIASITVPDVGTIKYNVGGSAGSSGGGGGANPLKDLAFILDAYRRFTV